MTRPRVVITGVAGVTPLGLEMETTWKGILAGESGIGPITLFDASEYKAQIAGEVKGFDPEKYISKKEARHQDRFTQIALAGAAQLMEDSGFKVTPENAEDTACILGVGIGGLRTIEVNHEKLLKGGPSKISPFMIPAFIANMAPGLIAIKYGIRGPNAVVTTACASATHAIGQAYSEIVLGRIRACVTGGVESAIMPIGISGFCALKALCTDHNDDPTHASRPFDAKRNGFVSGEGCGLLMLERLEDAQARGAKIYAEVVGCGASCDAFHMTAPDEDGSGMAISMQRALKDAGLAPEAIGHVNAHATSTYLNDLCETRAMKMCFGEHAKKLRISATKSMTGHLLGGAGGIEACFTALALRDQMVPGTINLKNPDPECDLDYTADGSKHADFEYAMSNNFGFGGTNSSLIFKRWDA